jgi:hypothetical protein
MIGILLITLPSQLYWSNKCKRIGMKKKPSRLTKNLIEIGKDLRSLRLIDKETHKNITTQLLKKR